MKFINRQEEMRRLNRLIRQPRAGVVVIWGRRRIGKTRLLLEWVHKHRGVYYTADESAASIQRKYFATSIEQILPNFSKVDYPDWTSLFLRLANDARNAKWRGPIVIDELPYLISVSPELPSILQKFIDHEAKKTKLIIALCGSSQRMMQGAILDSSAPLYGRADEIIKLGPITASYMKEALKLKKPREVVESYTIWGGIPRYWELVEKNREAFFESIDQLVLNPMGPLHEEPNRLLLEELPSAIHLRPILDAIGLGAHRLSEVASRIGQPVTSLTRSIQRLIELDLIERETPYGTDLYNSKRTLYKIRDPFTRFWFHVVAPKRSSFSQVTSSIRHQWLKQSLPYLFSIMWEELCRSAVPLLFRQLDGISYGQAGRFWQGPANEWDILAKSEDDLTLLIGEAKWTAKTPTIKWIHQTVNELKSKGIPPIERRSNTRLLYVLFIPEKPKRLKPIPGVKIIDAREIIKVLR
jgi:AAA+ ATPase superfamily predicted ATPase